MLNEFRSTYITWDKATSRIYSPVTANASDENGRKLVVQIVNGGQVEDLSGATLHLYWETRDKAHDGLDVFKAVDLKKGEFELSYTTGMLSNHGVLNANLVLIDTIGRVVSERFKITVTEGIDNEAIQSENSFTTLTQALIDISNLEQNYAPRLNDLTAQLQQTEQSLNAQLAQKANQDEVRLKSVKNELEDMSPTVLAAINGGEDTTFNLLTIPQDRSVSPEKTDFINTGKNLFDKSKALLNKNLVYNTGELIDSNAGYFTTYPTPVVSGRTITITTSFTLCWLDELGNFKSGISAGSQAESSIPRTITVPEGVKFVQVASAPTIAGGIDNFMIAYGTELPEYEEYYIIVKKQKVILGKSSVDNENIKPKSITRDKLSFVTPEAVPTKNLHDESTEITGYYVNQTNGNLSANETHKTYSANVAGLTHITFSQYDRSAFYDINGVFIANSGHWYGPAGETTREVPVGAYTVKYSYPGELNPNFQIESGTETTDWVPNGYTLPKLIIDSPIKEEVLVFLPSEIDIAVGTTIELYNRQVVWTGNMDNYHIQWVGDIGRAVNRKWTFTATNSSIGEYPLRINVYDNNMNLVKSASTLIKVVSNILSVPKEILTIGDSLTNNKAWLSELRTLSGDMYTLVGSRGIAPLQHEGRSGFSANAYLKATSYPFEDEGIHPFWDGARFNWNHYKTTTGINPDAVNIFLGTNGITLDPTANAYAIKQIVDYIRQDDATIPIFVAFTLYRGGQDGIGKQASSDGYSAARSQWKLEEDRKVFNLMVELNRILKGYALLHFVPISLTHDSEYNFGKGQVVVNPRSAITEPQDYEATHPQKAGYLQMADIMFSTMTAHLS